MTSSFPALRAGLALALLAGAAVAAPADAGRPQCVIGAPPVAVPGRRVAVASARGGGFALTTAPHSGALRVLVILAEYSDLPHHIAAARYASHLFGSGTTITSYYDELSGGRLTVTGDVHGWFTLPQTEHYYSNGEQGVTAYPHNGQKLAEDAVAAAIAGGVNLADYDADGDHVVDALLVIHSGEGYEWAGNPGLSPLPDPDSINSHKWVVTNGDFGSGLPRVEDYFTGPELQRAVPFFHSWSDSIATIGVLCHELGHVLGLPDFYDTQLGTSRIGPWEIMDAGVWNWVESDPAVSLPGALPGHFSAWSRMFLGWASPVIVAPPVGDIAEQALAVPSASTGGSPLQLLDNPGGVDWTSSAPGGGEYFLAEVRARAGFDAGLPGEGLLVFHVDEGRSGNVASAYADGAGLLLLVPQDGSLLPQNERDDPWPGIGHTTFDEDSDPSSALNDGSPSGVALSAIHPLSAGSVALTATVVNLRTEVPIPFARPNPYRPSTDGEVSLVLNLAGVAAPVTVTITDLLGRRVRTLDASSFSSPGRIARWNGRADDGTKLPAGVYFFRARGGASGAGRVLLLR
ncbi:MAG: M6 family metalloprotease domain-containing protein [bacterium]